MIKERFPDHRMRVTCDLCGKEVITEDTCAYSRPLFRMKDVEGWNDITVCEMGPDYPHRELCFQFCPNCSVFGATVLRQANEESAV